VAEIIDLTNFREFRVRELERIVAEGLKHPDERVLSLWKEMAVAAVRKYPGPPSATQPQLNFNLPGSVSESETNNIREAVQEFFKNYHSDVQNQMMEMLKDICLLQKEVAECRVNDHATAPGAPA
jgi:hypothetical protein